MEKQVRSQPLYWVEGEPGGQIGRLRKGPALLQGRVGDLIDGEMVEGAYIPPKMTGTTFLQPEFPAEAGNQRLTADARVHVSVDAHGRVIRLRLVPGYALGLFGPEALKWVTRWDFKPATQDGKPTSGGTVVRVRYFRKP